VDQKLPYPEGTATAEVLRVGDNPGNGLRVLALAGGLGAIIKFIEGGLRLWPGTAQAATVSSGGTVFYAGMNLSPALLSVGYIVGLNVASLVFVGGLISWGFAIPIYSGWFIEPGAYEMSQGVDLAYAIWSDKIRYLGVGAMLVGGIWALVSIRGSVLSGIRQGLQVQLSDSNQPLPHTERDMPMRFVLAGIVLFVIPIFALYQNVLGSWTIGFAMTLIMITGGFLFSTVAGYMAGLVGSSNNPVSGVTIATILFASLLLLWLAGASAETAAAAILIGAVVCCAAAIAGDNMQDLKAGYLLGATPWKQQLAQGIGVISAALIIAPILNLLLAAYGIGPATDAQPNSLAAPQANLMASVASGVLGGQLPWDFIAAGAVIGTMIICIDEILRRRGSLIRTPVLAVAVGIYLPFELSVPIFIGGLIAWAANRGKSAKPGYGNGVLFAAGLITGEALIGIFMAIPIVATGNPQVLAAPAEWHQGAVLGLMVFLMVGVSLAKFARQKN